MKVTCEDRDRILLDGMAEEWMALEHHAESCTACAEQLRAWKELSVRATELREYDENPALWKRIEASLREGQQRGEAKGSGWESIFAWVQIRKTWQLGLSGALVLVLALAGGYVLLNRGRVEPSANNPFLKDHALADVEQTERDYRKAIDQLATEAKPQLQENPSPLMATYQEKLMVLDSAIGELRVQTGQNRSNAHLRYQLLAMYQEKEATLRDVLETKR